ncbi:MAG: orotidine-5'-phosphate decarboxylase, partial [Dehalococcoidia bacterium]
MFVEKLRAATESNNSYLCVGLDPDRERMPHRDVVPFLRDIIEATKDLVCAYKPNFAFFEALGTEGMQTLLESMANVPADIPIIADAKRGDIGNSARFYADAIFGEYGFDAVTVNGYGGRDAVQPFLDYDGSAMQKAVEPEAVRSELDAILAFGSRFPGEPGFLRCEEYVR